MNSIGTKECYCYFRRRMKIFSPPPGFRPPRSLVLVGMMGAGKSSIGLLLADRLGLPFTDTDAGIEAAAGCSIADIFTAKGEESFRQLEHETLRQALTRQELQVIAAGGGAFVQPRNHELIRQHALSIWLKASVDTLYSRIAGQGHRPLLQGDNPRGRLAALLSEREPVYKTADLTIEVDTLTPEQAVEAITCGLRQYMEQTA